MAEKSNGAVTSLVIGVDDKLSLGENILYGLQHVFVLMLAPLITPIIFASVFEWDINITAYLVMIMIVGAGIETFVQAGILKLPVAQAQHIVFIAAMISAIFALGPIPVWIGLAIVEAITLLLVIPFKKGVVGKLLPYLATPVVIGPLFIVMGVSLMKAACLDLIFPPTPNGVFIDAGNVILAGIAVVVPLLISLLVPKGIGRYACVLWGVLAATIVAIIMGKVDFARVAAAPWFVAPKFFTKLFAGNMGRPVAIGWNFIPALLILFVAEISNVTDTVGCYQATAKLVGQKLTGERTNKGLFVETASSLITTLFGNIPCTSFSQNLGVLSLSRVGAKSIIVAGGLIMIVVGRDLQGGGVLRRDPLGDLRRGHGGAAGHDHLRRHPDDHGHGDDRDQQAHRGLRDDRRHRLQLHAGRRSRRPFPRSCSSSSATRSARRSSSRSS